MDRRRFMTALAATLAACSSGDDRDGDNQDGDTAAANTNGGEPGATEPGAAGPAAAGGGSGTAPLGVQLYTIRDLMAEDVAAALDLVASVGFEQVEFAGYFDRTPAELRRLLSASGLTPVAAHVGVGQFEDDAARVIDHAAEMGHDYVVIPSLPDAERSLDDYRRHAGNFNRWGEASAAAGVQFAYHNHMFEFDAVDGRLPYDLLLEETDPELVKMELDFCWAEGANADAVRYFEAWPGRFPLCHLKDFADGRDADIGTGSVDFDTVLAAAKAAGLRHGFVERDRPDDAAESIRANYSAILDLWNEHMA